jgi:hypothetical protein
MNIAVVSVVFMSVIPFCAFAGQPMKCVDGSGRVVYTELSSCSEALRAAPTAPKSKITILREQEKKAQDDLAKAQLKRELVRQEFRDKARKMEVESDYRERQRLMLEDERRRKECEDMLVESDRRDTEARAHPYDPWWLSRSQNYDNQMEQRCGHEVRLRRN